MLRIDYFKGASLLYIAALFLFVTLFGPHALYAANQSEFQSSFAVLIPQLLNWRVGGVALLALAALAALTPRSVTPYVASFFLAVVILLVVEFTFLIGDTQEIGNVETGAVAEYGGIGLRMALFAAALAVILWQRARVHRFAAMLVAIFIGLQAVQIGASIASSQFFGSEDTGAKRDFTSFSTGNSIIHIVLDEYQTSFFEKISEEFFPGYEKELSGFTFFRNNAGRFPNTHHAMYSLYRNKPYLNDIPSKEWIAQSSNDSILDPLVAAGMPVEIAAQLKYGAFRGKSNVTINEIPSPYRSLNARTTEARLTEAGLLRQLTLQRLIPQFAHSLVGLVGKEADHVSTDNEEDPAAGLQGDARSIYLMDRAQAGVLLFDDLAKTAHAGGSAPSYKMIHILTTHNPAALDEQCNKRDRIRTPDWEAMTPQTICAQRNVFAFLQRLKDIGAYDNAMIIIHADHGKRVAPLADNHLEEFIFGSVQNPPKYNFRFSQVMSSAMPLLLVKPKGASGPLKVSEAPVSFADIAPTILAAAGAPVPEGQRTVFDIPENEKRTRSFYYYHYPEGRSPYLDRLIEYHIDGKPWLPESWTQANVYLGKDLDFSPQAIDFGTARDRHYLRDWWRVAVDRTDKQNPRTIAYSMGPLAEIAIRFPDREDRVMTVTMRGMEDSQVVDVTLNGESIGKIAVPAGEKGYADYKVDIPGNLTGRGADQLDVIGFAPERLTSSWPDPKADRMQYGIAVDAIGFSAR